MKVLCVDASECHRLKENKVYTAYPGREDLNPANYLISELNNYYCQDRFIPISDIDETQLKSKHDFIKETQW